MCSSDLGTACSPCRGGFSCLVKLDCRSNRCVNNICEGDASNAGAWQGVWRGVWVLALVSAVAVAVTARVLLVKEKVE